VCDLILKMKISNISITAQNDVVRKPLIQPFFVSDVNSICSKLTEKTSFFTSKFGRKSQNYEAYFYHITLC
jgi:hypothetical protein